MSTDRQSKDTNLIRISLNAIYKNDNYNKIDINL